MSAVTYNAVVRDHSQAASSSVVGRLLLPDLKQVPSSWKIEYRGKVLERTIDLNEIMCSPQEPLQVWKPRTANSVIYLSTMSGKLLELPFISPDTTVGTLKSRIQFLLRLPNENQLLTLSSRILENEDSTLKNYGVQYGSIIKLARQELVFENGLETFKILDSPFDVFVKTLTGKDLHVRALPSEANVLMLKCSIQNLENIPPDQQRIIYQGKQLEDEFPLRDYCIEDGTTLHLVLRLRGGAGFRTVSTVDLEAAQIAEQSGGYTEYHWHGYKEGLNLLGVCPKLNCISNRLGKQMIMNAEYGEIKMTPGNDKFPCPACPGLYSVGGGRRGMFSPENFLVSSARSLFRFKKAGYDQPVKAVLMESLGWTDKYKKFDASEGNAEYDFVEITTVKAYESPYFCVICASEKFGSMWSEKILRCGHAYHLECAPEGDEECVVCLAELFENLAQLLEGDEGRRAGGRKRKVQDGQEDDQRSEAAYMKTSRTACPYNLRTLRNMKD